MADLNHKKNSIKPKHPGGRAKLINPLSDSEHQSRSKGPLKKMENVITGRFKKAGNVNKVAKPGIPISNVHSVGASKPNHNGVHKIGASKSSNVLPITKSVDKETTSIDKLMAAGYEWVLPCVKDGDFSKVNDKLIFIEILNKIIGKAKHKEVFEEVKRKYNRYLLDEKKGNVSGVIRLINEIKENGYGAVNG